ncbi:NADPH-dependent 1-acyldihydroxyacetone phosphate reductase [Nymphaea thermarum]|nr:NADPH-dependent 1-acyldihydroxyacetone phosphate reductase [Nymphaea thermarum]
MGSGGSELVVLITGCTVGGIGHALAVAFASKGCRVVATSRSLSSMEALDRTNAGIFLEELDVSSPDSIDRAINSVMSRYGRIDVLVNNAGVHSVGPLAELPLESLQSTFDTNVFGPMRVIQAVVPHMLKRRSGKIANIGSVVALAPGPWAGAYSASKAALHALTDTLRMELKSFNIDVITVVPGGIKTNLANNSLTSYSKLPEWKFYKPFEAVIQARTHSSQGNKCTPAEEFAEKTVTVVLRKNPPAWFSYGRYSTIFSILYHVPLWVRDSVFRRIMGC